MELCNNLNQNGYKLIIILKQIYIFFLSNILPQAFITAEQILSILSSIL